EPPGPGPGGGGGDQPPHEEAPGERGGGRGPVRLDLGLTGPGGRGGHGDGPPPAAGEHGGGAVAARARPGRRPPANGRLGPAGVPVDGARGRPAAGRADEGGAGTGTGGDGPDAFGYRAPDRQELRCDQEAAQADE